jgi:hypothetical protein
MKIFNFYYSIYIYLIWPPEGYATIKFKLNHHLQLIEGTQDKIIIRFFYYPWVRFNKCSKVLTYVNIACFNKYFHLVIFLAGYNVLATPFAYVAHLKFFRYV